MNKTEELKGLFAENYKIEITDENADMKFGELGLDSLKTVQIFIDVEEKLGCDLYESNIDFGSVNTFNKLADVINNNIK